MAYRNFIERITRSVNEKMDRIATRYNFDYGDEFEMAVCELLTEILPAQYGICRGFAITAFGDFAGDDILIYAKDRFPTLRFLKEYDFSRKEEIPIEAVYAYIEAKHTLIMDDPSSGQSIEKAITQVSAVKNLPRPARNRMAIDPYTIMVGKPALERKHWPDMLNPLFGMIVSRHVKLAHIKEEWSPQQSNTIFEVDKSAKYPDLAVLGQDLLMVPTIMKGNDTWYESPFFLENESTATFRKIEGEAFATGIITLLYALDTIRLDKMPFRQIVGEQLKIIHPPGL